MDDHARTAVAERTDAQPPETMVRAGGSRDRRWWTLGVLCLSLGVIGIDNTILNVALPTLVRDVHASNAELQWIVDGYILVFAGLLLTGGSLGDRFGRRGALTVGLVVFATGSACAAWSSSATQLTLFRSAMGIGGALIMPATLSILTNVFTDPKERGRAIGVWAGVAGIGIALGPIIGGLLLEHFWWGSVFLVNVPVAAAALVLGRFFVPTSKDPAAPRLDVLGALLSVVGLCSLLYAIIQGPTDGWGAPSVLLAFAGGAVFLGAFAAWELHSDHPMLDVSFFRNPRFTVASLSITSAFFAMSGALFLLTQLLQFVKGYDALSAGIRIAPLALVLMIVGPISPRIVERIGTKRTVAGGLAVGALGLVLLAGNDAGSSYMQILLAIVVMALGLGLTMAPATESIMGSLPRAKAGVGSAVNDTTRQTGGALGVAVLGSLFASGYRASLDGRVDGLGLTGVQLTKARSSVGGALEVADRLRGGGVRLTHVATGAYVHGMRLSMLAGAVVILAGAALALRYLPAHAADHPGHELNATELLAIDVVVDEDEIVPAVEG